MIADKLGYVVVDQTGATSLVKSGPAGFFGLTVTASTAATVTVYDNTAGSGAILLAKDALTKGEVLNFGSLGIAAKNGIFVVVGGTGSVVVLYT